MSDLINNNQNSYTTKNFYEKLKKPVNNKVVMFFVTVGFVFFLMSASFVDKEMNVWFYIFNTSLFVSFVAILNSHWFKLLNIETSYRFKDNLFRDAIISILCFGIAVETAFSISLFTSVFGQIINTIIMFVCYLCLIFGFSMTCHILILKHDIIENRNDRKVHKTS